MFKVYTVNGQEYEVSNEKESQFLQEFPNAELIEDTVSTPTETVTEGEVVSQPGMLPPSTQLASQGETPSNIAPAVRAEEGFWSELYQSVNQYWTAAGNTEETLDIAFGDVTEEDIEEYQKALIEEDARGGPTQSMLDFYKSMEDNGGGLLGGFKAFWEHPEVGVQQAVGSMAGLIRTGFDALGGEKTAGAIGAGTAAGAGIGAGIGAAGFVAGPFGAVTTTGGAIAGGTRGAYGSLSGLMEGTGKISELMREHLKGDYSTENIRKVLNDDAVMSDIRSKAIARGLTIAAVDGITGGLGKAVGGATKATTRLGINPAQVATEAVGGGVGEALAQQAAGEEYDAGAIVLEATSGPSTMPAEAGLSAVQRLRNAKKDGATRLEDSPKKEIKDGPSAYRINGQPLKKEAFLETINKMNPEDVKDANISVSNDSGVNKYISDIVRNVYENDGKKKPPSGGAGTAMDLKALDKESKRIQPAFMDNAQDKYIRKIGDLQHQLENVILEGAPPEIEESLREQIAYQENLLRKSKNEVNKEVYKLNPLEKTELNELKSQQRLYQSFINNERAPDEVKKIAKEKLNEIENKQLEVFFSPTIRSTQASQKAQQIFENEGVEAYNKIIDTQEGLIRQIAINKLNSVPQSQRRQGDVEALVSELKYGKEGAIGIIEKYDSTKNPSISSHIGQTLKKRVHRAAKKIVPQLDSKDFSAPEVANVIADETGMVEPTFGPKVLADMLQLPNKLIDKATKAVPAALQNVVKALTGDKGKTLNKKKRINLAEKSIADIIEGRVLPEIKKEFGKNTKNKKDFDAYLNRNWVPLTQAFLAQKSVTKGEGVSKAWSMFPPSQAQVKDYFNGSDIIVGEISKKTGKPITAEQKSRAVADRKASLAEAVSKQFALELQEEYLAQNPKERKAINEEINEGVAEDNVIMFSANENSRNETDEVLKKQKQLLGDDVLADMATNIVTPRNEQLEAEAAKRGVVWVKQDFNTIKGRDKIIEGYNNLAKKGYLNPAVVEAAKLANFGALYLNEKIIIDGKEKKQYLVKGEGPSSLSPDTDLMMGPMRDGVRIYKKLSSVDGFENLNVVVEGTPEYDKAFNENRLIPNYFKGSSFYSTKQPALVELIENSKKNYKGDKTATSLIQVPMTRQLGLLKDNLKGKKGSVNPKKFKEIKNKYASAVKENQKIVKQAVLDAHEFIQDGGNPNEILPIIEGMFKATTGGVKVSYEFGGYYNGKYNAFMEEHSPPVNEFADNLVETLFLDTREQVKQRLDDMYNDARQYVLPEEKDNAVTRAKFKARTPYKAKVGTGSGLFRLISVPEIDVNELILDNGKTAAEQYLAALGIVKPNPDLQAIQKEIVKQNIKPVETMMLSAQDKRFNNKEKIELTEAETAEAFLDILQGNWNRDGSTSIEVFTDPNAMVDILMNEFGQTELKAKEGVEHFGFKIGDKIFINLKAGKGLETGVHEAGHVWNSIVYKSAPKVWNGIISRVKESGLWDTYLAQVKRNKFYNDIVQQYENGSNVFNLENEIFAKILEDYGGKKIKSEGSTIDKIKKVIKQYFNELALALGFDPTTKNFGDLTVNEMIDLAVSEVVTGDPLANFSKLKDSEGKSWFRKTKANIDPAFKASIDPEYQGLKSLNENYRTNGRNLLQAIKDSYNEVKDIMSLDQWTDFVMNTVGEVRVGKTPADKALVIAKKDAVQNEKLRQKKISLLKEADQFKKGDENLTSIELDKKLKEIDSSIKKEQKEKNKAEGLNKKFRQVLNSVTGTWGKPSKWFVPPSAEDIKGLLYAFLPGGKAGVAAKKFFKSTLLDPYYKGVAAAESEILQRTKQFNKLIKDSKIDLNKNVEGTPYAVGQAIKVYNWVKQGIDVDVKKSAYIQSLVDAVENNPDLKAFAEQIENNFPIEYHAEWRNDSFNKSIYQEINTGTRRKYLEVFSENVDLIFDKDNLQEIENKYGKKFRQTLDSTLKRMKTGRNRISTDSQSNAFLNWVNRAVATTMFVNTRSAMLQLLSSLNFIGKPNNNIFQATGALFSGSWRKDFNTLWNSDYLKSRREGAKFDVLADEISEKGEKGLNKLLKWGFLPTRMADSFAIALGGSAFYGNTVKALMKDGMSETEAKKIAMQQWIEAAEESQQSADPAKISEIQASNTGKLIYAFANTPFQYIRKQKRHLQDVASGRSFSEGGMNQVRKDLQSVLYYSIGQAMMFNALQSALFAVGWEDDEEKRKALLADKEALILERALTSYMKSMGNPGAITGALYSMIAEGSEQIEKKGRIDNAYKLALEATSISPPLNAKLKDLVAIGNIYKYNYKEIQENPLNPSVNNPTFEIAGNAASFVGVPLDRVIRKAQNLSAIANEETEAWQKVFQTLGWNEWDFYSPTYESQQRGKKAKVKKLQDKLLTPKQRRMKAYQQMTPEQRKAYAKKRLSKGLPLFKKEQVKILGKAHKDGTIEIAPGLSPEKRRKVEAHEKKHWEEMQSGKLDYSKDWVRYGNKHYKRTPDKKVVYNGKKYIEGHPKLPWEIAANKAESRVS